LREGCDRFFWLNHTRSSFHAKREATETAAEEKKKKKMK
jgi:hypothetical protein